MELLEFAQYIRKPFTVDAVEITAENISEVAKLVGELREKDGETYIALNRRIVPNVGRAYAGWFMTCLGNNYRCYSPKVFNEQFIAHEPVMSFVFDEVEDEFDATPPHGIVRPAIDEALETEVSDTDVTWEDIEEQDIDPVILTVD